MFDGDQGRRHDAHADSKFGFGPRDRRGGRPSSTAASSSAGRAHRFARASRSGDARETWDAVFIGSGARGYDQIPGQRKRRPTSTSASTGCRRCRSAATHRQARRRARRQQYGVDCCRSSPLSRRCRRAGRRAVGLRRDESVCVGEGRRDARGHSDSQLPGAAGVHPRRRPANRRRIRGGGAARRGRRQLRSTGEPHVHIRATTCSSRSARKTRSRGSSATSASTSTSGACPSSTGHDGVDATGIYFGGDAAFGPKNIIWAVAHGPTRRSRSICIAAATRWRSVTAAREPAVAEMGIHEWSYDSGIRRSPVPLPLKDTVIAEGHHGGRLLRSKSHTPKRSAASIATCRRCSPTSCASG